MYCRFCGELVGNGNDHACPNAPRQMAPQREWQPPTARGTTRWARVGWGLVAATGVAVVLGLGQILDLLTLYGQATAADDPTVERVLGWVSTAHQADTLGATAAVLSLLTIVVFAVWARVGNKLVAGYGDAGRAAARHWSRWLWRLSLIAVLVVNVALPRVAVEPGGTTADHLQEFADTVRRTAIVSSLRTATWALFVFAIVMLIRQIQGLIAATAAPAPPAAT